MSYNDFGTGDGGFYDFDNSGSLDSFESGLMQHEQDVECERTFRHSSGSHSGIGLLDVLSFLAMLPFLIFALAAFIAALSVLCM